MNRQSTGNLSTQNILFEDIFEVNALNENGKKFERGFSILMLIILVMFSVLCFSPLSE
jgi:hypothetical protein